MIEPEIFKTYDIRGSYPQEVNEEAFLKIGSSFARLVKAENIVVAGDNRFSSGRLKQALIKGLISANAKIRALDLGVTSTPCFYWAVCELKSDAGLMVTASHLGKSFNGVKPVLKQSATFNAKQINQWKKLALKQELSPFSAKPTGFVEKKDIKNDYLSALRKHFPDSFGRFKIVMDAGNTALSLFLPHLFNQTDLQVIPLFWRPDGSFPNRGLNPKEPENRRALVEKVRQEKADFGFIWDGDGDRFYALDNKGQVIDPSFVSALIASYLTANSSKKKIAVEVRTSRVVFDEVEKAGGEVVVGPAWHTEIKQKMRKDDQIIFGSETSGHYVFREFHFIDDGLLAAIYFLKALSAREEPLAEILEKWRKSYFIIEETNFLLAKDKSPEKILDKIAFFYQARDAKIKLIDGLSVDFDNWRFNLRPSKSEPLLRLNLEADSKQVMEEKTKEVSELIKKFI